MPGHAGLSQGPRPGGGDVALRSMLETHIDDEQRDIEELEMYLEMVQTSAVMPEVALEMVTLAATK